MSAPADKCPIDNSSSQSSVWSKLFGASSSKAKTGPSPIEQCPVDHSSSKWADITPQSSEVAAKMAAAGGGAKDLPTDRVISSIPRTDTQGNWMYPSQQQFYNALSRKNHNPRENDMRVVVPIHNAVNERTWRQILEWENGQGGEWCGGVKLATFRGRPNDTSPKAWWKALLGYQKPFDRHDWIVDRCGTQVRYIIDFYTGKSADGQSLAFYLDVRPALDNWEGFRMRASKLWEQCLHSLSGPSPPDQSASHAK